MKLTKQKLKQIIKEELSQVLIKEYDSENYGYASEEIEEFGNIVGGGYEVGQTFMRYWDRNDWQLSDMDEIYMFLNDNPIGIGLSPRYGDKLGGEGIKEILNELSLKLPIGQPADALRIYAAAKSAIGR